MATSADRQGYTIPWPKRNLPEGARQTPADLAMPPQRQPDLPHDPTAPRLSGLIKDLRFVTIDGGPHSIVCTHADEVNTALEGFLHN